VLYLAHLGLALAAQLAWETTPIAPEERLWILALLCLVPFALGRWTRRLYLKGKFRATDRAFAALQHSPVALHGLAVLGSGWNEFLGRILGESPGLLGWPGPSALLTLLPFVVYTLLAIEVRARLGGPSRARATRRSHWRMFSATLLPLLVYVLLASLVGTSRRLTIEIDSVGLWNALYSAFLILLFALGVPWLFRRTWDARPLPPGPERDVLHAVSALARFDGRRLFLWNTGNTASNAAIIGLFPWHRIVVFSDLLLAQLDPRQLACVFAHEIGHAKRRHVLIFAAWALAALFGGELFASAAAPDDPLWNSAILLAAMALWVLGFGWMSRRFELEADIYSLRLMGDADALVGALELVSGPPWAGAHLLAALLHRTAGRLPHGGGPGPRRGGSAWSAGCVGFRGPDSRPWPWSWGSSCGASWGSGLRTGWSWTCAPANTPPPPAGSGRGPRFLELWSGWWNGPGA
jgi:Zn-dependent protease with chaperone function